MNVYILTEGGNKKGFGHITRCLSLIQAFNKKNIFPTFYIDGDNKIESFVSYRKTIFSNWIHDEEKILSLITSSDIVIIDSYHASQKFYDKISQKAKAGVYFDDYERISYPKGIVIRAGILSETHISKPKSQTLFLEGHEYIPLRQEFSLVPKKKIRVEIQTILLTFGGADKTNMTATTLHSIQEKYKVHVIVGIGYNKKEELVQLKNNKTKLYFSPSAEEIKKLMLNSDIAISAGGQTLFELIRVGIPIIAIATADNQVNNIASLISANIIAYAGTYNDSSLKNALETKIAYFKSHKTRQKHSDLGRKYIDGLGSKRIVEEILHNY
jgi:UDP-2,4-diacetamido-2,4,6-trideoxy-beta-L-altropyranose hydrolase